MSGIRPKLQAAGRAGEGLRHPRGSRPRPPRLLQPRRHRLAGPDLLPRHRPPRRSPDERPRVIGLLRPAPPAPPLPADAVDPAYKRLRVQVFIGIFVGYAAYYLVRNNLALAIPDILREYPQHSKAELGTALTALSIAYGVSKFLMGSVSDKSNPRYFFPLGLLLSARDHVRHRDGEGDLRLARRCSSRSPTLNGWVQGMGWPPCGKTMVHWFSTRERGRTVSLWNVAHNIGGGLVATFALARGGALPRLGREALLQRDHRRRHRGRRVPADARHAAVVRAAAGRGVPQRLPARLLGGGRADPVLPRDLPRARPQQPVAVGDRGGERVRLLRALRRRELDPHLPGDGEGLLVQAVEHGLAALRVRRHPGHAGLRLDVGHRLQGPARPRDHPLHGADPGRRARLLVEPARPDLDRLRGAHRHRLPHLRADHDHRPARPRPRAQERGRHRRRLHRLLRLRVRVRHRRHRRGLDRRPLGMERRLRHHGRLLRADHRLHRPDPRATGERRAGAARRSEEDTS